MTAKQDIEIGIEFCRDEIAQAPRETLERLRYAFPELPDKDLLPMAAKHPKVARIVRKYRRALWRYQKGLAAGSVRRRKGAQ